MKKEILPLKNIPEIFEFDGDYYATQSSLILAALSEKDVSINNYNRGMETDTTIEFLKSIGINVINSEAFLRVETGYGINISEDSELHYEGTSFPLSLIIGLVAGRNCSCTLKYAKRINPDIVDNIVDILNKNGIDIHHEADNQLIVFRASSNLPLEINITASIPHLKNCLVVFALSSSISVNIREFNVTSDHLERCLDNISVPYTIYEPKIIVKDDPIDPRKKIREREAEHLREIRISSNARVETTQCYLPNDATTAVALITLAVLKRKDVAIPEFALNRVSRKFIDYIKAAAAEVSISDRKEIGSEKLATVTIKSQPVKAKKMSGSQGTVLIDEIPFMSLIASRADGKSIFRGIADYNDISLEPFKVIAENLDKLGVKAGILEDGLVVEGVKEFSGVDFGEFNDSKIGLAFLIAALAGHEPSTFEEFDFIENNYPVLIKNLLSN